MKVKTMRCGKGEDHMRRKSSDLEFDKDLELKNNVSCHPESRFFPVRILVLLDVQRGKKRMEGSGQVGLSVFYWRD